MFRVGDKVVYVGRKETIWHQIKRAIHPYKRPDKDAVYTVCHTSWFDDGCQAIELAEFPSPYDGYWEAGFYADAFRPAVNRKTDISFTEGAPKDSERFDNRRKVEVSA